MATGLKIQVSGEGASGLFEFDEATVLKCDLLPNNESLTQVPQNSKPNLIDRVHVLNTDSVSSDKVIIKVILYHFVKTVKTHIESLQAYYDKQYQVYYQYISSPATYVTCLLDPNYENILYYGQQAACFKSTMIFYQTEAV